MIINLMETDILQSEALSNNKGCVFTQLLILACVYSDALKTLVRSCGNHLSDNGESLVHDIRCDGVFCLVYS